MNLATPVRLPLRASVFALSGLVVLAVTLALTRSALAGTDPVKGGKTTLDLKLKHVKVKARGGASKDGSAITLPTASGNFDPVSGSGKLVQGGTLKFKYKGHKARMSKISSTFGSKGKIDAKVGKATFNGLAKLSGGSVGRDDFGGKVTDAKAKLTKSGAKALFGKKGAKKAKGTFASVSTTTVPRAVEVQPGGTVVLAPDNGETTKFALKGVNPALGVSAVDPATMQVGPPISFTFPITGGSLGLDFNDGRVQSKGGLKLTKTEPVIPPSSECESSFPVGVFVNQFDLAPDFTQHELLASVQTQNGTLVSAGAAGTLDLSDATTTIDHATRQFTMTGAKVKLLGFAAALLNDQVFGPSSKGCGPASSDFAAGDVLGTLSMSGTLR